MIGVPANTKFTRYVETDPPDMILPLGFDWIAFTTVQQKENV